MPVSQCKKRGALRFTKDLRARAGLLSSGRLSITTDCFYHRMSLRNLARHQIGDAAGRKRSHIADCFSGIAAGWCRSGRRLRERDAKQHQEKPINANLSLRLRIER